MLDNANFDRILNDIVDENRMYTKQEIIEQAKMCWGSDKECKYESSNIVVQYAKEILKNVLSLYEDDYKFSSPEFCNLMENIGELWKFETIESMLEIKEVVEKKTIYKIKKVDDIISTASVYKYLENKFQVNKYVKSVWQAGYDYDDIMNYESVFITDLSLGAQYSPSGYEANYKSDDVYNIVFGIIDAVYNFYGRSFKMSASLLEKLLKLFEEIKNSLKAINAEETRSVVQTKNYISNFLNGNMEKVKNLIAEYICDFIDKQYLPNVVDNSIPIVWFGNIDKYWASENRIVTLGINPSEREFIDTKKKRKSHTVLIEDKKFGFIEVDQYYWDNSADRFNKMYFSDKNLTDYELLKLKHNLKDYFRKNPYIWFKKNNKLLEVLDCSYGCTDWDDGKIFKNTGIHIDIYSAIATTPTWGKLSNTQKEELSNLQLSSKLLKVLNPDIILSSVSQSVINEIFSNWKLIAEYKFKGKNYIRAYKQNNQILINGTNCHGTPFGGIKEDEVKETILNILNLGN